jgi:hypothetical protein
MKKLLLLVVVILAPGGFYVGWPAWSGYQISEALKTHDAGTLERKIDFASVRVGIRPLVATEVEKAIDRMQRDGGSLTGALAAALRKDLAPRIVDAALNTFVTPENVVRLVQRGGSVRDMVRQSITEQTGRGGARAAAAPGAASPDADAARRAGGLGGMMERLARPGGSQGPREEPPSTTAAAPTPPPPAPAPMAEASASTMPMDGMRRQPFSYANIKHFRITGPVSFEIGFNRNTAASEPEVIAEMAFRGGDWKVIRFIPRIEQ